MKLDFYGIKADSPTKEVVQAFGSCGDVVQLEGGQRTTYRSGDIVLKPTNDIPHSNCMAEVAYNMAEAKEVRFAKPIKSIKSTWTYKGYVAWEFLEGTHQKGYYAEKIKASQIFHKLLNDLSCPEILKISNSSWSVANEVVWGRRPYDYNKVFNKLIDQIIQNIKPLDLPNQLVHGDLSGNFLMADKLSPAIIDFSPTWAVNGFAEGIMLADAIAWEFAEPNELESFMIIPNIEQLAWRGVLRRVLEQAEHIKWFGKDEEQAFQEAVVFEKAVKCFKKIF